MRWDGAKSGERQAPDGQPSDTPESVGASDRQNLTPDSPEANAPRSTLHASSFFEDSSRLLNHSHTDEPFDDFARQPLLPQKFSQLGPGVAWFDVDADGWDDLIVGSGKGGQLAVYENDGKGSFKRLDQAPFNQAVTRDQTGIVGLRKNNGTTVLLIGSANYEDGLEIGACVRRAQAEQSGRSAED